MRTLAYLLLLAGCIFIANAIHDEHRGIAAASPPRSSGVHYVVARAEDPVQFRNLMTYEWVRGVVVVLAGLTILGFCRRADRLDPFSPNFAGSAALDELSETLTEEERKRRSPEE